MRDLPIARSIALALCTVLGPTFAHADVAFTRTDLPIGHESFNIATGDLDGDGDLDLVTSNIDGTLSVLLGTGNGAFGAAVSIAADPNVIAVTIGDVNGDGAPDLITPNRGLGGQSGTTISVFLGHGDGTFAPHVEYSSGGRAPTDVAIGDFNGDGHPDLAVSNNDDICQQISVGILLGHGDGTFDPGVPYNPGCTPNSVEIADLDRDGFTDIATALNPSGMVVLRGNGDGTFTYGGSFAAGPVPYGLALGDLNGDGRVDAMVPNPGGFGEYNTVTILLGQGDGTFGPPLPAITANAPYDVAAGDLDGDGSADMVTVHISDPTGPRVLLGNGDGSFGPPVAYPAAGGFSRSDVMGDFDGDGRNDFAIERGPAHLVSVYRNVSGTPTLRIHVTAGARGLVAPLGTPLGIVTVPAGGSRTFSITPDPGHVVEDVIVDGVSVGAVSSYSFDGVTADHSIQATFLALPPAVVVEFEFFHKKIQLGKPNMTKTVEARIEPPAAYTLDDIDLSSLRVAGVPISDAQVGDLDHDGIPEWIAEIDRSALDLVLPTGDAVTVEVHGKIAGRDLVGADLVEVTRPKVLHPNSATSVQAGAVVTVQYEIVSGTFEYAVLLYSLDDGATWSGDGVHHPNTGEIAWLVPSQPATGALLAVVQVESEGDPVTDVTGALAMSEPFSIDAVLDTDLPVFTLGFSPVAPMPSHGKASFRFTLPAPGRGDLDVFDASGRRIRRLTDGVLSAGAHTVEWRGDDGRGARVPAGVYQARLRYEGQQLRQRVVWLND